MHTRVVTFSGAKDVEGGLLFVREKVVPLLQQHDGFRGVSVSVDRDNDVFAVLSLWDSAEQRDATDAALAPMRAEAADILGGEFVVGTFEELVAEVAEQPPGPGSWLMVTPTRMDPSTVDDNVEFFTSEVLPQIRSTPGFRGVRNMTDRATGEGIVGTAWADRAAMERAAEEAMARREIARGRGISFGEVSFRELVFFEMT